MLSWFRRHAKVLMVVLGSAAMAIFGLGPVFDRLANSQPSDATASINEVVAKWKGGNITRQDLMRLQQRHAETMRFLGNLREAAVKKKNDEFNSIAIPIQPIRGNTQDEIDASLISRYLMAERAKMEGIVASDEMVNDYITMFTGDANFSERDLRAINKDVNRSSLEVVREHMKTELLSSQMQLYSLAAIPMVPNPTEATELYARSVDQVECEVLPIKVEDYADKVQGEPTAAELQRLYEEGKFEFADPTGMEPGFKIGRKVNVQYFVANFDTFLQNEMNALTDEEIQKEYDRLVAERSDLILEPAAGPDDSIEFDAPPMGEPGTEAPSDVDAPPSDLNPPMETPAPPAGAGGESETPLTPPADPAPSGVGDGEPATTEPATTEPATTEPATTEPPSTPPAGSGAGAGPATSGGGDQSLVVNKQRFQFASTSVPQETGAQGSESAQESKPAEATEPAQESATTPAATTPAATEAAQDDDAPAPPPSQPEIGGLTPGIIQANDDTPERAVKPLKDVVEVVKRTMAEKKAIEKMREALTKARDLVDNHFDATLSYDEADPDSEEPAPFDYQAVAKEYGVDANETGLVDNLEMSKLPLGQVRMFLANQGAPPIGEVLFQQFEQTNPYESNQVTDFFGNQNQYVFWIEKKEETRVPEFSECKDEIVSFWRTKKAYELAMAEAEAIKTKVNEARTQKLSETRPAQAIQTGAFTWFNSMTGDFSTPVGVTFPGNEFMKTAFSLAELEAGVAPNRTRDTIYVIQTTKPGTRISELGTDYLENQYFRFERIPNDVVTLFRRYGVELNGEWMSELQKEMEFKFVDR